MSLKWSWENTDESVKFYRWQLNSTDDDKWNYIDSSITSLTLDMESENDTFYLEASYDGINWSERAVTTYTYEKEKVDIPLSLRLNVAPYSSAVYFFYEGHYIDKARTLMGTIYGVSTSLEFDWTPFSFLRLYPEFGYAYVMKIQTVIPKEQDMQYIKGGLGLDGLVKVSKRSDIYLGALGGIMAHINNKKYNVAPYFGARLGFETSINDHITLGAFSRVTASFLTVDDDTLYSSVTLLVDPVCLTLSWSF